MSLSKQEFTNAGRAMLGAAQAGHTLTFTQIVVGSWAASGPSDLWPLTALVEPQFAFTPSTQRDLGNGTLLVEGTFRSDQVPHAFYLRELGVMAHVDSGSDQLYSVANSFADPADYIDPAAPTVQAFKIKLIIDRVPTDGYVVQIGPTEAVLGENLLTDSDGHGVYSDAAGNVLYFKRLAAGPGVDISENTDGTLITIGARQLNNNVDLYVPTTYVGPPPGTPPSAFFATVQAAHDYLLQFHIPANVSANIHVDGGHFANAAPINFTHPDSVRINVLGRDIIARTFRAATNIVRGGALPTLTLACNLNDASGIAVNDVVHIHNAPQAQLDGCGVVQSIAGTTITIAMRIANVLPPASIAPLSDTRIVVFPTQFTSTITGTTPVFNCPNGIGRIKAIAFRQTSGAQQGQAIGIAGGNANSALEHVVVSNFSTGIGIAAATNFWPIVAANNCGAGIEVGPAGTAYLMGSNVFGGSTYSRIVLSGNVVYGLWVAGGTWVSAGPPGAGCNTWCCSNSTGVRSDARAWIGMGDNTAGNSWGFVVGYNVEGCVAALMGIIQSALATISIVQVNTDKDFIAASGAQIGFSHNASMPPPDHFDPPNYVLGVYGGYIHVVSP